MSFRIEFTDKALDDARNKVPLEHASFFFESLEALAEAPAELSTTSAPPAHAPGWQIYQFMTDDELYGFIVYFKYGQDEESLIISNIGVVPYADSDYDPR